MIRHVSMLRWKDPSAVDVDDLLRKFGELPSRIPSIQRLSAGADEKLTDGNYDFVLIVDFPSADDWREYNTNADHLEIAYAIAPNLAERCAVQYTLREGEV
jgi:hypothetical protein